MARENYSIDDLINLSNKIDEVGYYSILFTYHSKTPDYFIKIPHIINKSHRLKYMIAIRTHAISPEYLKMQCDGFNDIQKNRLMINFVAGQMMPDEETPIPLIDRINEDMSMESRKNHLFNFIKIFTKFNGQKPEIVMSGSSDIVLNAAEEYADITLNELDQYIDKKIQNKNISKKMVVLGICIRDTKEEVYKIIDNNDDMLGLTPGFFGTKEEVLNNILKLQDIGVTDIMVAAFFGDPEKHRIHDLIKDLKEIK
jgi:hypothetical protein